MQLQTINPTLWGNFAKPGRTGHKRRIRAARCCTDATIMLNGHGERHPIYSSRLVRKPFAMYYSREAYRDAFGHFRELGVRPHVATWIRPDTDYIMRMADELAALHDVAPFATVLLDAESAWTRGFPGPRERPKRYYRELEWIRCATLTRILFAKRGLTYGLTDVPMVDWSVVRTLAEGAAYLSPQCHEFGRSTSAIRRPGRLVSWTHSRWPKRLEPHQIIEPHLGFYRGTARGGRPAVQTQAGLRRSIETCLGLGYTRIGGWTSRTFAGRGIRRVLAEYTAEIRARGAHGGTV